ncbi:hypothetical protein ACN4EE_21595 [Geminocystis sp. CENA526]|uniref:hypothetical protein n=1 Tax=Geminocystis sp. CENA526 TaxID=1355871 RepID=UPI003D6FABCF
MLFKEEPNSKIWAAQKGLFLPSSYLDELSKKEEESFIKTMESLSLLELVIVYIGLLPKNVREEYKKEIILTQEQEKVLSIFQKQYQDISQWLVLFAFPDDKKEAQLKEDHRNLVKPFADYFWNMLDVLKICLEETGKIRKISVSDCEYSLYLLEIAKLLNSNYSRLLSFYFHILIQQRHYNFDYLFSYWYRILCSYFMESIKNGGFITPLPNNYPKSKRELMKIWKKDLTPRLHATSASMNDYSMFSEIDDNWELFEDRLHRIYFDNSFRWAKENNNYKVIEAVSDLLEQEKKLIDIINKRKGSGEYQVMTIHHKGINVTGRNKPEGFRNLTTSNRKKSKRA